MGVEDGTVTIGPTGAQHDGDGSADPDEWIDQVRSAYEQIHARLWQALVGWSGSTDVADEAVAESFAQLLRRAPVHLRTRSEIHRPGSGARRSV